MKKIIFGLVAATGLMVACDPVEESGTLDATSYNSDCVQFTVYKDAECTQVAGPAEGNYVHYTTSPATTVAILNHAADGSENLLAWGPTGTFKLSPKRGASTDQELIVRTVNNNNQKSDITKTVSVWVKSDLDPEIKLLLGEAGRKKWAWAEDGNNTNVWGNAGNTGSGSSYTAYTVDGMWWGVNESAELINSQMNHAAGDETLGALDAATGSYMELDEDGNIVSYTADGSQIRKSSYQLTGWDSNRGSGWQLGTFSTAAPAVLWPYSINENGKQVTEFDVMYLDGNHMTLVYTKGNGAGSWGEITYWRFVNASPSADILENNGGKWGWAHDGEYVWGNAGNTGSGSSYTTTNIDGRWWGVISAADLLGQLQHAEGGVAHGDESDDAYMIFNDGKVTSYAPDGSEIRSGAYELSIYSDGRNGGWELGKLNTNAVLFPYSINENGLVVNEFDVMFMNGNNMTLVYTKGNGAGSWGEITYWRFGAVK